MLFRSNDTATTEIYTPSNTLSLHDALPISLAGGIWEMTKSTNVVLAITNQRLIAVATGFGGAPRDHGAIPLEGLEIVSQGKKEFVLRSPEGEMRIRGAAKPQIPDFLDALAAQARPSSAEAKD